MFDCGGAVVGHVVTFGVDVVVVCVVLCGTSCGCW